MSQFDALTKSMDDVWAWMARGLTSWRHPMRAPTCITSGVDGPRGRTMVLRDVGDASLIFFTDKRSPKVMAIEQNPRGALHAYDAKRKVQVQLSGVFEVVSQHAKMATWRQQGLRRHEDYGQLIAPGQPLSDSPQPAQRALAEQMFTVLRFEPDAIEILQLSSAGHRRAVWTKNNEYWSVCHLTP